MVYSLYLDVTFDESSFEKYFEWIEQDSFQSKLQEPIPVIPGEVLLRSIKIVDKSFIMELEQGIQAFETYLLNEYGKFASFPYLFYERSGLVH